MLQLPQGQGSHDEELRDLQAILGREGRGRSFRRFYRKGATEQGGAMELEYEQPARGVIQMIHGLAAPTL